MKKSSWMIAVGLLALLIVYRILSVSISHRSESAVVVATAKVEQRDVDVSIEVIGTVEALSSVAIKSMVTGPLLEMGFKEGDLVTQGQMLFQIDPRPFEAALEQAKANLARDQALMSRDQATLNRHITLVKKGFTSKENYDALLANAKSTAASVLADEANIKNAELQLAYTKILAPISGKTGNITQKIGSIIKANDTTPLVTINQINPIYVSFSLAQQYLPAVQTQMQKGDMQVTATINPTMKETGKVVFIDNQINTVTGNVELKAEFSNQSNWFWPGQFVNVNLTVDHRSQAILIPSLALLSGQHGFYVYVIDKDSIAHTREVKPGPAVGTNTIIESGLTPGDLVVTSGQLRIQENTLVTQNASP